MNTLNSGIRITQEWTFTAKPPPGVSLDELEKKLLALGHKIVRREADGIVIAQEKRTQEFRAEDKP